MISIPIWALALIVIIAIIIGWKIIKFALAILLAFIVALLAIAALDYFNIFTILRNILSSL